MFTAMIETLKAHPRKIVFTEGSDAVFYDLSELYPDCEKFMAQTGRDLIKKFEEEKNNGKISGN